MDVATIKKDLENQIGSVNEDLKNIYLPHETVLILLGKRTAFEIALELIGYLPELSWDGLEEAADAHIRRVADTAGHPGGDWTTQDIAEAFKAGAEWGAAHARKEDK